MESIEDFELGGLITRSIETYNTYRSPEVTAVLLGIEKKSVTIEFQGSFCPTCGVQDYFEDFIYTLSDLNSAFEVEIAKIEQTGPLSFRVQYVVERAYPTREDLTLQGDNNLG